MKTQKISAVAISVLLALSPAAAFAGAVTGGATFPEQIAQEITAGKSLAEQITEVATQIRQYANMIQNMETIPQQLMGQITATLDQFTQLSSQAEQLASQGANIASQFQNMNAGSVSSTEMDAYEQDYATIASNLNNSIDNVLQQANLNPSNYQTVAQAEQAIQSDLQNPTSRNNLLQAAAEAGQAETSQLAQLNQTANAQANLQAEVEKKKLAKQEANKEANKEAEDALFGGGLPSQDSQSAGDYTLPGAVSLD